MPDVCPAVSALLDLEVVFCCESLSFGEVGLLGFARGLAQKSGYIRGGFLDHGFIHILIVAMQPPRCPILDGRAITALVELRKKPHGVFAVIEVRGIESRPIVVGNKAAMETEVRIEPVGEVFPAKPVLKKPERSCLKEQRPGTCREILVTLA